MLAALLLLLDPEKEKLGSPSPGSFPTERVTIALRLKARVNLVWYSPGMELFVGDNVYFEGQYTYGDRQPYEPRNPKAVIMTPEGAQSQTLERVAVGRYWFQTRLTAPGPMIVKFQDGTIAYTESAFEVYAENGERLTSRPVDPVEMSKKVAREMMVEDLLAAGIAVTDAHSDSMVEKLYAMMLSRRARR